MKVGDLIKCASPNDAVNRMCELAKQGIYTDFEYMVQGERGLWLVVEKIDEVLNGERRS